MKFKDFKIWCSERAHDGRWGLNEAIICIAVLQDIKSRPFWKREKEFKKIEPEILSNIINPTNEKIRQFNDDIKKDN